jgi:hypothetical protein
MNALASTPSINLKSIGGETAVWRQSFHEFLSYWTRLSGGGGVANAASVLLSRLPGFRPKTPLKEKVKAFIAWWRDYFGLGDDGATTKMAGFWPGHDSRANTSPWHADHGDTEPHERPPGTLHEQSPPTYDA